MPHSYDIVKSRTGCPSWLVGTECVDLAHAALAIKKENVKEAIDLVRLAYGRGPTQPTKPGQRKAQDRLDGVLVHNGKDMIFGSQTKQNRVRAPKLTDAGPQQRPQLEPLPAPASRPQQNVLGPDGMLLSRKKPWEKNPAWLAKQNFKLPARTKDWDEVQNYELPPRTKHWEKG